MKKLLSLCLVVLLAFGLAACGQTEEPVSSEPTIKPASSAPPVSSSEAEPEPEPVEIDAAMLTGLPKGDDYPGDQRVLGVMVNNISGSRPTRGLSEAQVVYEIKVEGGITRFMAVFEDYKNIPTVGGVRSARDQFFQMLLPLRAFYVHDGPGNDGHPVNLMMRNYEYSEFDLQPNSGVAFRLSRPGMKSEYTEYTDAESVIKAIENKGADDFRTHGSPIFNFVPYTEPARVPSQGAADEVGIIHSTSYRTIFNYDSTSGKYLMSQYNSSKGTVEKTIDENNDVQVAFDNVLVIFAPMQLYNASELVKVDYSEGGGGYYISQGHWEPVIWRKGSPESFLTLENIDGSGERVTINPGTTYIAVVDDDEIVGFDERIRSGSAGDAAQGTVNTNEVDE